MAASPYSAKLLSALDRALQGASLTAYWVFASRVSEMEAGVMRLYLLIMESELYRFHRVSLTEMPWDSRACLKLGALLVSTEPEPVPPYIRSTEPWPNRLTLAPCARGRAAFWFFSRVAPSAST